MWFLPLLFKVAQERGLYLVYPHGSLIAEGLKRAILKKRRYHIENELLYLIEGNRILGKIVLGAPKQIRSKAEFMSLFPEHRVTPEEALRWWKTLRGLYFYPIKELILFKRPRKIELPRGVQTFVVV
ncbi:MAG: hypothetical protein QXG39_02110 [Candidatus Aenigmatarchaeota archaeon]